MSKIIDVWNIATVLIILSPSHKTNEKYYQFIIWSKTQNGMWESSLYFAWFFTFEAWWCTTIKLSTIFSANRPLISNFSTSVFFAGPSLILRKNCQCNIWQLGNNVLLSYGLLESLFIHIHTCVTGRALFLLRVQLFHQSVIDVLIS